MCIVDKTDVSDCKFKVRLQYSKDGNYTADIDLDIILWVCRNKKDGISIIIAAPKSNTDEWDEIDTVIFPRSVLENAIDIKAAEEFMTLCKSCNYNDRWKQLRNELLSSGLSYYNRKYIVKLPVDDLLKSKEELKNRFFKN